MANTTAQHRCSYPSGGCTSPDCDITAARFDERVTEALMRVDHDHRITCTGPGEVGCLAYPGWHSWLDHRRHVAVAQLAELRRVGLLAQKEI